MGHIDWFTLPALPWRQPLRLDLTTDTFLYPDGPPPPPATADAPPGMPTRFGIVISCSTVLAFGGQPWINREFACLNGGCSTVVQDGLLLLTYDDFTYSLRVCTAPLPPLARTCAQCVASWPVVHLYTPMNCLCCWTSLDPIRWRCRGVITAVDLSSGGHFGWAGTRLLPHLPYPTPHPARFTHSADEQFWTWTWAFCAGRWVVAGRPAHGYFTPSDFRGDGPSFFYHLTLAPGGGYRHLLRR